MIQEVWFICDLKWVYLKPIWQLSLLRGIISWLLHILVVVCWWRAHRNQGHGWCKRLEGNYKEWVYIKDLGSEKKIHRMEVWTDRRAWQLCFFQQKYIQIFFQSFYFNMEMKYTIIVPYLNVSRSLMCVMIYTRPNLAHLVNVGSRFVCNTRKAHWEVVEWIQQYLKGTINVYLVYRSNTQSELVGYVDSDHGVIWWIEDH